MIQRLLAFCLLPLLLLAACGEDSDPTRNNDFVPLTGITIDSARTEIPAGFSNQFTATGDFSGAFSRDVTNEVVWSSSEPTVLTFDDSNSGRARSVAQGSAIVTASRNGIDGTLLFTVNDATLASIAVTPATASVAKGLTQQFEAEGTFSDASTLPITDNVAWASSDIALVTVDATGLATAVAVGGPVTITAGYPRDAVAPTVSGTAQMTVTDAVVESIRLTPEPPVLTVNETHPLTAEAVFSDGSAAPVAGPLTWASDTPAVATVSTTGVITAVAVGTATITAEDSASGLTGTLTVTVGTVREIAVTPANPTITVGEELQLTATATMSSGSPRDITSIATWNSSDTARVVVNSSGVVTGNLEGSATVTATKSTSGSTLVTVQSGTVQ